jgi:hypothetical protein
MYLSLKALEFGRWEGFEQETKICYLSDICDKIIILAKNLLGLNEKT